MISQPPHIPVLSGKHTLDQQLYVVTSIFNPIRFQSRYKLYRDFEKMVQTAGGILYTIEIALGDRPFYITSKDNPQHVQLRTWHELWFKENGLNLVIDRLPLEAQKIAWIDADLFFANPQWVKETLELLEHFMVIQMFSHSQNLGPNHEPVGAVTTSFVQEYYNKDKEHSRFQEIIDAANGYHYYPVSGEPKGHPGYAWAARREALDDLGQLIDWGILGANDRHMAFGLIGAIEASLHPSLSADYRDRCLRWQQRAIQYIKRDIGLMPGMVFHYWHGKIVDRRYHDRWRILIDTQYDPELDIKYDSQGLLALTDRSIALRDGIRAYFRARNEDSIDLE
jgi:hypothetical protein